MKTGDWRINWTYIDKHHFSSGETHLFYQFAWYRLENFSWKTKTQFTNWTGRKTQLRSGGQLHIKKTKCNNELLLISTHLEINHKTSVYRVGYSGVFSKVKHKLLSLSFVGDLYWIYISSHSVKTGYYF